MGALRLGDRRPLAWPRIRGSVSAWLAPGAGTCLMVEAIVRNQGRVLPCSVELQGEFGVKGAFVGVPVKLTSKGG